jgi:hypothetical protein
MTHRKREKKGMKWNKQNIGLHAEKDKGMFKEKHKSKYMYSVLRGWRTIPIVSFLFVPNI